MQTFGCHLETVYEHMRKSTGMRAIYFILSFAMSSAIIQSGV